MPRFRSVVVFLCALAFLGSACGDDSSTSTIVDPADGRATEAPNLADEGGDSAADCVAGADCDDAFDPAAGTCPVGTQDCNDTPGAGDLMGVGSGMLADGGLTVEAALSKTPADGVVAVTGHLYIDEFGTFMCGGIAESFPPQCASGALEIIGLDLEVANVELSESERVQWSDATISLLGLVDNGVLTIDPTVN